MTDKNQQTELPPFEITYEHRLKGAQRFPQAVVDSPMNDIAARLEAVIEAYDQALRERDEALRELRERKDLRDNLKQAWELVYDARSSRDRAKAALADANRRADEAFNAGLEAAAIYGETNWNKDLVFWGDIRGLKRTQPEQTKVTGHSKWVRTQPEQTKKQGR